MTLRDEFRGPVPLDDRDFAEVRGSVLAKIERRPLFPTVFRFAAAAAVAAVLVFVLIPGRTPIPSRPPALATKPAAVAPVLPPAPAMPAEAVASKQPMNSKSEPKPLAVAENGAPPSDMDMTIQIQTADPNVRIIWIANR
ncbi:MAG TPA: hypothetical protein VKH35_01345 [Thermoanaerobaculia bacterium]|nr:hypothetical protein [Thermoanaerobaculia bacterium]